MRRAVALRRAPANPSVVWDSVVYRLTPDHRLTADLHLEVGSQRRILRRSVVLFSGEIRELVSIESESPASPFRPYWFAPLFVPASVQSISRAVLSGYVLSVAFAAHSSLNRIGDNAFAKSPLKFICLPSTVLSVGSGCFRECQKLGFVGFEWNSRVTEIGVNWFRESKLPFVVVPNSVEAIREGAFAKSALRSLAFELGSRLARIESNAFQGCQMVELKIPKSVSVIGPCAIDHKTVQSVSVETGSANFRRDGAMLVQKASQTIVYCEDGEIAILFIDGGIRVIGEWAFAYLGRMREFVFLQDSQLECIAPFAFFHSSVRAICIPRSVKRIGESAFAHSELADIDFEFDSGLQVMEMKAFASAQELRSFVWLKALEVIERETFANCTNLCFFHFEPGSRMRAIRDMAFAFSGILNFTIPGSVLELGKRIFVGCHQLDSLVFDNECAISEFPAEVLPNSAVRLIWFADQLEMLRKNSLSECKNLECVTFNSKPALKRIEALAFSNSTLYSFCIPASVEFVHPLAFDTCTITLIDVETSSPYLSMLGGFLATKDRKRLIRYYEAESVVEIPKEAIEVGKYCLANRPTLEQVHFELGSVARILGKRAFASTFIETICIPASVRLIQKECFSGCEALESVRFEADKLLIEIERTAIPETVRRYHGCGIRSQ
jgi:hypothetical protein